MASSKRSSWNLSTTICTMSLHSVIAPIPMSNMLIKEKIFKGSSRAYLRRHTRVFYLLAPLLYTQ